MYPVEPSALIVQPVQCGLVFRVKGYAPLFSTSLSCFKLFDLIKYGGVSPIHTLVEFYGDVRLYLVLGLLLLYCGIHVRIDLDRLRQHFRLHIESYLPVIPEDILEHLYHSEMIVDVL